LRFVTPALKHIVFPLLSGSGYLRYAAAVGPVVVTYHGVFPLGYELRNSSLDGNLVHAHSLRRQLALLKKRYCVISPEDFHRWSKGELSLPPRAILLTCDDALRNHLTEMVPILREFGVSCLFFATGASAHEAPLMLWYEELYLMLLDANLPITLRLPEADVSNVSIASRARVQKEEKKKKGEEKKEQDLNRDIHASWWHLVERLSRFDGELRRRFLDQIRDQLMISENWRDRLVQNSPSAARFLTLDRAGLMQLLAEGMAIGAHSLSHPILAQASEELVWREISESRIVLEKALGQAAWAFAYPFGNAATVTRREWQMAERSGFDCAFMNTGGELGGVKVDRFALPRVHVTADMNLAEFEAHISGFYHALRKRLGRDE
jgi:peptidoglycan/xylan/chitin deacetylase (PgdA/CDA1 family)